MVGGDPAGFPDVCLLSADEIDSGQAERGITVYGAGVGAAIACNKIHGIWAALRHDTYSARQCVEHHHVKVATLGAQVVGPRLDRRAPDEPKK